MSNDIASIALACNNNVTSGDKVRFYYITMYQSKRNQAEEASPYNNICIALSKRLQFKKKVEEVKQRMTNEEQNKVSEEEITPDMCEGIGRVLSSLYAHT